MEKGLVVKEENNLLTIRMKAIQACYKCSGCTSDGNQALLEGVKNTVRASVGDYVLIDIKQSNLVTAGFIIYVLPVIFLITGYFLGTIVTGSIGVAEKFAVLISMSSFIASFFIISIMDKQIKKRANFKPILARKL